MISSESEPTSLHALPGDMLREIGGYLSTKDLENLALVSKKSSGVLKKMVKKRQQRKRELTTARLIKLK